MKYVKHIKIQYNCQAAYNKISLNIVNMQLYHYIILLLTKCYWD